MNTLKLGLVVLGLTATSAFADSSWNTLQTVETINVNASPDATYAVVSKWDALESWCPAFASTVIESGGTEVGSVRAITLKDGPTFTEELLASDPAGRSYRYKIIDSPLPIVEYVSTVRVIGSGSKSSIIWVSSYKRRAADNPTAESDDQAMLNLVGGLYKACLGNAKKVAEQ